MGQASRSIRNSGADDEPPPLWTANDPVVTPHCLDGVAPSLGLGMKQETRSPKETGAILAQSASERSAASSANSGARTGPSITCADPAEFSGKPSNEPEKSSGLATADPSLAMTGSIWSLGSLAESADASDMFHCSRARLRAGQQARIEPYGRVEGAIRRL